ncbi:MAG: gamma carbonic anhydrase family protein [Erysipelotrichaceae bacterium]
MIQSVRGKSPQIDPSAYIHETATIIGDVIIGPHVSIWPYAVLRGDEGTIIVEEGTNIQDHAIIHTDAHATMWIQKGVTIGHRALLHGGTIEQGVLIGMGAIVLGQVHIKQEAMIGAGSLLSARKVVEAGSLWLGTPAFFHRMLSVEEIAHNRSNASHYQQLAHDYLEAQRKQSG